MVAGPSALLAHGAHPVPRLSRVAAEVLVPPLEDIPSFTRKNVCLNEASSVWADLFGAHGSIILTKTDYFVVAMLSGTNQYNFFDYGKRKSTHLRVFPAMLDWDPGF